jgi:hypothetical protein
LHRRGPYLGMQLEPAPLPAVDEFVDAILQSYGQLTMLVEHMERYPSSPDADPITVVLKRLFTSTLGSLVDGYGADDVATAAKLLAAATDVSAREIYFVDPESPPRNRAERRARRGGH